MKIVGLTGPSTFTGECCRMIERHLDANPLFLYQNRPENISHWLQQCDAVVLAGGADIHPTVYNQSIFNAQNLSKFDLDRDVRELAIIQYCWQNNKPVLGICRGHQLLGVTLGMEMLMDITHSTVCHNPAKANMAVSPTEPHHTVTLLDKDYWGEHYVKPDQVVERAVIRRAMNRRDDDVIFVNSFHHQAVLYNKKFHYASAGHAGKGVRVLGTAKVGLSDAYSDIIEAMEGVGQNWLSVQWHPEWDFESNSYSRAVLDRFRKMLYS